MARPGGRRCSSPSPATATAKSARTAPRPTPRSYDYQRAARDAIHFPALFDRLIQNLRRYLGYDVQYFATIEPQKQARPARAHRIPRRHLPRRPAGGHRRHLPPGLVAARRQSCGTRRTSCPFGTSHPATTSTRATGEVLPTWDQALDAIGPNDEPLHVARFGPKFDAQGVLAGTKDANRCVGYLTKYLTKQISGCHAADTDGQRAHAARLADALRYEPCSPTCANWLRYGIQPKNARPDLVPGLCRGKAHRFENLGYAGRRVLVSRKWSGKTLTDHRADRKAWLIAMLDLPATEDASGLQVGTGHARRPRPHAARPAAPARAQRPRRLEGRPCRSQTPSRSTRDGRFGSGEGGVNRQTTNPVKLLTVEASADRLSTSVRFIRRLIAERRIEFVKVGRHVRISEAALQDFIDAGRVQPMTVADVWTRRSGAA